MHPRRLLLLCVASNSKNKYWGYKLACIRAQVELSNTFVYDYEMSSGSGFAKNLHLGHGNER